MLDRCRNGRSRVAPHATGEVWCVSRFTGLVCTAGSCAVHEAFAILMDQVIPAVARELDASFDEGTQRIGGQSLSAFLHQRGVNVRFMLAVGRHTTRAAVRRFLAEEALVRVIKHKSAPVERQVAVRRTRHCLHSQRAARPQRGLVLGGGARRGACDVRRRAGGRGGPGGLRASPLDHVACARSEPGESRRCRSGLTVPSALRVARWPVLVRVTPTPCLRVGSRAWR